MGNRIIILDEIVRDLSQLTNTSSVLSDLFIKKLFLEVSYALSRNGEFVFEGIGRFFVENNEVKFTPDPEFASGLNTAFESFEPIELSDDFSFEDGAGDSLEEPSCINDDERPTEQPVVAPSSLENEEIKIQIEADDSAGVQESDSKENKGATAPENTSGTSTVVENVPDNAIMDENVEEFSQTESESTEDKLPVGNTETSNDNPIEDSIDKECEPVIEDTQRKLWIFDARYWVGVGTGILLGAIVVLVWNFFQEGFKDTSRPVAEVAQDGELLTTEKNVLAEQQTLVDSISADTAVVDDVMLENDYHDQYFTVTETAYLSNVSRRFYGHYAFWIYIYLENKDIIENPDYIPVGLTLKIPDSKRYEIDKDNPSSIEKAKQKAVECGFKYK